MSALKAMLTSVLCLDVEKFPARCVLPVADEADVLKFVEWIQQKLKGYDVCCHVAYDAVNGMLSLSVLAGFPMVTYSRL